MKEQNTTKEGSKGHWSVPNNKEQPNKEKFSNDKQRGMAGEQAETPLSSLPAKTTGEQTRASLSKSTKDNSPHRIRSQSRSKDRINMPKPKAGASSADPDGLSDANGEAVSHPGCGLIPITVEGIETLGLIDTGTSVSMLGRPLYQKIKQLKQLTLQTQETPRLEGVGGNPVPTFGHAEVEVGVGTGKYKAAVVVSA